LFATRFSEGIYEVSEREVFQVSLCACYLCVDWIRDVRRIDKNPLSCLSSEGNLVV